MAIDLLFALKLISVLGCSLIAGVFFAFSNFVMNALARLQPAQGIAAMQSINITVINPLFMTAFLGTGVGCVFVAISSLLKWQQISITYSMLGSLLYLIGTIGVTLVFNVPLNEALAKVEPSSADGIKIWTDYLADWTFWNHMRTGAAFAAAAAISLA
ncbi:anthrone oxygenase family protein [Chamaesiphon sp. OTE_8_metabat_110]|uniref:anthrone oxygenase family protein n=1 Tax=Chamaesiphon sp. OTE_8_metabat_110 TaxID=2964696 RepID=UPI00286B5C1A|nr:anthrone oxygenase family protein [Chamaesiphon sp. OTE_8_metabat_110]